MPSLPTATPSAEANSPASVPDVAPLGQEPPVAVEDLHAMVRVVGHEHAALGVHRRVHGPDELPVGGAVRSPPVEELALRREALHAVVVELGDQERAVGIEPDPERSVQLPRFDAALAPFGEEPPVGVEYLHGAGPGSAGEMLRKESTT